MTDQPPVQPPVQPPQQPSGPTPPAAPKGNVWREATSTHSGRWAIAIGAGALALLMLLGIGVAGFAALRLHDRFDLVGDRQDRFSRGQDRPGPGNGRGPDQDERRDRGDLPGFTRTALHGEVTVSANGSFQTLVFQRGEVTAVSATSITLRSSDGFTGAYKLTAATISRRGTAVKGGQAFVLARASDKVAISATAGKTSLR